MPPKITHDEFVEKLKIIKPHLIVLSQYNGNKKYITVKCTIHNHTWESKPNWLMYVGKYDCQKCYDERRGDWNVIGIDKFIERARLIHGNKYDYSKVVYVDGRSEVCIIYPIHGDFFQTPDKHTNRKQGCPKCANKNVTTEEFIAKTILIHGDRYDYSKVKYINNLTEIIIGCPIHGDYITTPDKHLQGHACQKCSGRFMDLEYFIEKSNLKHNNRYDYSLSKFIGTKEDIYIICPIHGGFWQNADNHLQGAGCPICKSSKVELIVRDFLFENNIDFIYEKKFPWLGMKSLDFYMPNYNIAIEVQGGQHFRINDFFGGENGFKSTVNRDVTKNKLCLENGIDLIYVMDEIEFDEDILTNELFKNIYNKNKLIIENKLFMSEALNKLFINK